MLQIQFLCHRLQDFLAEVKDYQLHVNEFHEESRGLMESSRVDKDDVQGIEKTRNTLEIRWNAVNDHLRDRQNRCVLPEGG